MTSHSKEFGVEVIFPENWYQENPKCAHGPMLMFERAVNSRKKRFFACSACRDRKDCQAPIYVDGNQKKKRFSVIQTQKGEDSTDTVNQLATYEDILRCDETERHFCSTCQKIIVLTQAMKKKHPCTRHGMREAISLEVIYNASRHLFSPLECDKRNAQYFLAESSTELIRNTLTRLGYSRVVCIGMPTLHESIQSNLRSSREKFVINSILLDIDLRFVQTNPTGAFCHFNMFNHHVFDDSLRHLEGFLADVKMSDVVIVLDPPFGGMVDAIAETIKWLRLLHLNQNKPTNGTFSDIKVLWIFPYFMEKRICSVDESIRMLDYQVHYENHKKFKKSSTSNRESPVRIFTNVELEKFILPTNEGYRFCNVCRRYVSKTNLHCAKCDSCTTKHGKTYIHCDLCEACFKPGWTHCATCNRCRQQDHNCSNPGERIVGCYNCGKISHKRRNCPVLNNVSKQSKKTEYKGKSDLKRSSDSFNPASAKSRRNHVNACSYD